MSTKTTLPVYDPNEVRSYKVGFLPRPMIVTEIKRPDSPAGVLVLASLATVELTNEEVRVLLKAEAGPLIPRDLLEPVAVAAAKGSGKAAVEGDAGGVKPEGSAGSDAGSGEGAKTTEPVVEKVKKPGK